MSNEANSVRERRFICGWTFLLTNFARAQSTKKVNTEHDLQVYNLINVVNWLGFVAH